MINTNKRWLLTASPWTKQGLRLSPLGIKGMFFAALLLFCNLAVEAQVHPIGSGLTGISGALSTSPGAPELPLITGGTTICMGTTTNLINTVSGGTWSSSNPGVATVNSTGLVTGVHGGVTVITYTVGPSSTTTTITVTYPITGVSTVCVGNSIFLIDSTPTGLWSSSNTAVANVSPVEVTPIASGQVNGIAAGTANITYIGTAPGACPVILAVTVGANGVAAIGGTGALGVCVGGSITATDATGGGSWSSSSTAIATINSSGIITGVTAGGATITYTQGGCYQTKPVSVMSPAAILPISGPGSVCVGNTIVLNDATHLGTWGSSNTAIATVNTDGSVRGIAPGTATISYTKTGCSVTDVVTVNANTIAPITGNANVCIGQTTTLSDTSGAGTGTWSSSNTALATVAGGVVTGVATGSPVISYTLGGCSQTLTVAVNPVSSVGAISGTGTICKGSSTTLTDAVPGGTWSTSNPAISTVNAYGLVTGVAAGTDTVYYTRLGCFSIQPFTVNPVPAAITGTIHQCSANSNNTTTLSDGTLGGTWSSSNTAIATVGTGGIVSGVTSGVVAITYTLPATGCYVSTPDTVYGPAAITGGNTACIGLLSYLELNDATFGGVWSATNSKATTSASSWGTVTPVSPGLDTIKYTVTYFTGFSCYAIQPITVAYAPGLISGNINTCVGSTTTLTDTTAAGAWSSNNNSIATVGTSGIVSGVGAGAVVISYTKNGCTKTINITVGAPIKSITGLGTVCDGRGTITLTDSTAGGIWTTSNNTTQISNPGITLAGTDTAIIIGFGKAGGGGGGWVAATDTIYYTYGGCTVSKVVNTIANTVTAISGLPVACTGLTTTLASAPAGGVWSSGNTAVATVGSTGIMTGVAAGTTNITYTTANGCFQFTPVAVHTQPAAITSTAYTLCSNTTATLTDSTTGGTWTSSNPYMTSIGAMGTYTTVITGIAAGHVTITYSMPGGCESVVPIEVIAIPALTGTFSICGIGNTVTIYDSLHGGIWSHTNAGATTLSGMGIDSVLVTSAAVGVDTIKYTDGICFVSKPLTVATVTPTISSGPVSVCANGNASAALTFSPAGGTWTTGNPGVASVSSGKISGISAGTATITYTVNGCYTTQTETVFGDTLSVVGSSSICVGSPLTFTVTPTQGAGAWSSTNAAAATVGSGTGLVTGVSAGSTIISFTATAAGACNTSLSVNVGNVTPAAITVTTLNPMCAGNTTTYTDATPGGTWVSSNPAIAYVTSSGTIEAVAAGIANITYSLTGCYPAPVPVTVNPLPAPITGTLVVCQGSTTTLADTSTTGTWTSSSAHATVSNGTVTGVSAGSATISYTYPTGCYATAAVNVGASSGVTITGGTSQCGGTTMVLTVSPTGGTLTTYNSAIAGVSLSSGNASIIGVGSGVDTIYYATPGCAPVTHVDTVDYVTAIIGAGTICLSDSMTLTDATGGGTWSVSNGFGTINSAGQFNSISAGYDTVIYTVPFTGSTASCNVIQQVWIDGSCSGRLSGGSTGVANSDQPQVYSLFPNPSDGYINIAQSAAVDGAVQVSIMNEIGAKVYSGTVDFAGGKGQMNITAAPGMYLLLLQDNKGVTQTLKVVIEK